MRMGWKWFGIDGKGLESTQNLDIWIFGYLYSGQNSGLMHHQSRLLCGAALPGAFFFLKKEQVPGVLQPNSVSCIPLRQYSTGLG